MMRITKQEPRRHEKEPTNRPAVGLWVIRPPHDSLTVSFDARKYAVQGFVTTTIERKERGGSIPEEADWELVASRLARPSEETRWALGDMCVVCGLLTASWEIAGSRLIRQWLLMFGKASKRNKKGCPGLKICRTT
jgi:hypothetical protein